MKPALISILLFLSLLSCSRTVTVSRMLCAFEKETVVLPETMFRVEGDRVSIDSTKHVGNTMVFFWRPEDCTDCSLSTLFEFSSVFQLCSQYPSLDILCIFCSSNEQAPELMQKIAEKNFPFPVYVDSDSKLLENRIPRDRVFRSFLINKESRPVLVGNPIVSDEIYNLLIDYLDGHS